VDNGTAKTGALPEAPHLGRAGTKRTGWLARFRRVATWVAERELWLLAVVVPVLMASNRVPPPITALALGLVPVPWLCRLVAKGYLTARTPLDIPITLLLLSVLVSLYASATLSLSMLGVYKIIAVIALFYGLVNGVHSERGIRSVTSLLVASGFVASVVSLMIMQPPGGKLPLLTPLYRYLPQLIGRWVHPNYVGGTLILFIPVGLSLLLFGSERTNKPWLALATASMMFTLLLTQSRSAFLGVVIALLILGIWRNRWFWLAIPLLAVVGVVIVRIYGVEGLVGPLSIAGVTETGIQGRVELWQRAIYVMQDFPYTGISLNTFDLVVDVLYPLFLIGPNVQVFHAHNLYLQIGVELGIPGLVAFLGLLTAFSLTTWEVLQSSQHEPNRQALAIGLFCGVVAYLVYGLTDTIALGEKGGAILWTILALMVVLRLQVQGRKAQGANR